MSTTYECEVFTFDPNLDEIEEGPREKNVQYYKIGLGKEDEDAVIQRGKRDYLHEDKEKLDAMRKQPMKTLWSIMKKLEHQNKMIDVVKMV